MVVRNPLPWPDPLKDAGGQLQGQIRADASAAKLGVQAQGGNGARGVGGGHGAEWPVRSINVSKALPCWRKASPCCVSRLPSPFSAFVRGCLLAPGTELEAGQFLPITVIIGRQETVQYWRAGKGP